MALVRVQSRARTASTPDLGPSAFSAFGRTALVGAQVVAGPAGKTASVLAFARKLRRSLGARALVSCSSKPSNRHSSPLSAE
jgi:hypothetical protein